MAERFDTTRVTLRRATFDEQHQLIGYDEKRWLHNSLCITVTLENKA